MMVCGALLRMFCVVLLLLLLCVPQRLKVDAAAAGTTKEKLEVSLSILGNLNYDALFGRPGGYGVCNQGHPSIATPGCDSPMKLIRSVMDDVAHWNRSFTLITGGLLRHGTESITTTEVENMMGDVLDVIGNSSNSSSVAGGEGVTFSVQVAIGGKDVVPADSFTSEGRQPQFLWLLGLMESKGIINSVEHKRMATCGYYFRDPSGTKLRVISLNTMLWSNLPHPVLGVGELDPCGQFLFLQNAIDQATQRRRSVIVIGDTPPIINVAEALRKESVADANIYWREDFRDSYFRIIAAYRFVVAAQFFGHPSTFSFLVSPEVGPPLYIVPPISPVRGSNPSYLRATLDSSTNRVVSLTQRYLSENNTWVEGESLESVIEVPMREKGEYLSENFLLITEQEKKWEKLMAMHAGGRFLTEKSACGMWCRRVIVCASRFYRKSSIERCAHINLPSQRLGLILAIVFTCFSVLLIALSFGYVITHYKVIFHPPDVVGVRKGRQRLFSGHTDVVFNERGWGLG
ncbi:beta-fructofuranosidase-like protein [Trypanosoma rangeli]|uniref:Beta-fructofuranosidase-like protein n=1 Tax=Trypanosoma rangeli TaxID=5698 RepID=A0A3R7KT12_TRYRA|nr:beta-fructofuranosidase-like protein [Trypanosoma rangeli]RNF00779.1 beta-fructofuranosidase-like protein [Trypanosoma rangeli]|eukprot:RNF00779.1 beta-fructofuranosidase-like protein [Trypanosoma rangeli]